MPRPSSVLRNVQLTLLNPGHFLSIGIPGHLVMFQAVLIDFADVFAGRSSPMSPGLGLEPLIKRFFFVCAIVSLAYIPA